MIRTLPGSHTTGTLHGGSRPSRSLPKTTVSDYADDMSASELNSDSASGVNPLSVLAAFVKAHAVPAAGARRPILFIKYMGGADLQHHALNRADVAGVDEALIEELHSQGLVSITYQDHAMAIVPTRLGRETVDEYERSQSEDLSAGIEPLSIALGAQRDNENPLSWAAVRPVLAALRDYWVQSGYPAHGVAVRALLVALPDTQANLFRATITALVEGEYLRSDGNLAVNDLPVELQLTDRARAVLDGWPGAKPEELVENLLAVLASEAQREPEPERKTRLERVAATIKELGVATASEVIAKVLTGAV